MTARHTSSQGLKSTLGAAAFALGLLLLFVNLDRFAVRISSVVCVSGETLGILPALGLAGLHAVQAYTFDHAGFLASLLQILVSFWPLILIVAGVILLRPLIKSVSGPRGLKAERTAASIRGDR